MKCAFLTVAYNAEKTIARAMNSVLNQTYKDWIYYVVDNGSTDQTYNIIKRYARKNSNIKPYHKEINDIWTIAEFMNIVLQKENVEYFCVLDADDVYEMNFLKIGISYMKDINTDMAILGTQMIDAASNICVTKRVLPETVYLNDEKSIDNAFPKVHWYLRQVWGKIWRVSTMKKCHIAPIHNISYGADTVWVMQFLLLAKQVVIVNQIGYKYYMSPTSDSYNYNDKRVFSDMYLYQYTCDVLNKKCGCISEKNRLFLYEVYYAALNDSLNVICHADINNAKKIKALFGMVNNAYTEELIARKGNRSKLFWTIAEELCNADIFENQETYEMVAQTLANLGVFPQSLRRHTKGAVFKLLVGIRNYIQTETEAIDRSIVEMVSCVRYINGLSINELCSIADVVAPLLDEHDLETLENVVAIFDEGRDISELTIESIIECGLDIAAELNEQEEFICLKKYQIQALLQMGKKDIALRELEDWTKILPEDRDFENFQTLLQR